MKLKIINLSMNKFSDNCLKNFEKVLKNSDEAFQLYLAENNFSEQSKQLLRSAFGSKIHI